VSRRSATRNSVRDEDLEISEDQSDGVLGGVKLHRSADEEEPPVQT
jgi:hypothetical protein